ncbi:protein tramtrack, beta isoform isoform X5 [Neodiprion pinetum]|uniref:protein tramtrack, beta isoform isoform X5 n=1 Tax=Neodiprion pinetum TaxID=441929 RepID=UPI0037132B75
MEDDQQFCLRWNNHQSTLIQNFDTLLESGTLVDCTLAAEGKYLKAHKVVLSACSPYFEGLLSEHYDKHPVFILKDVKFKELKAMMDYMYRGEVNISQDQLAALLKAAESLQIKGLSESKGGGGGGGGGGSCNSKTEQRQQKIVSSQSTAQSLDIPHTSSGLTIEKNSKVPRQSLSQTSVDIPEDSASPQISRGLSSREGSLSPTSLRKRKKLRRRSIGDDNSVENHEASNSSDVSHSMGVPALGIAPVADEKVHADPTDSLGRSALMQQLTKPADEMLQMPIEKPEPNDNLIEPKSEYLEDPEESVEDLTLDDDMNDLNEMEQDNPRAGPSHDPSQHPGLASWHVTGDRSNAGGVVGAVGGTPGTTDEVFLAAQEAAQAHRDSQGLHTAYSIDQSKILMQPPNQMSFPCPKCPSVFNRKPNLKKHLRYECGQEPRFICPYYFPPAFDSGRLMFKNERGHRNLYRTRHYCPKCGRSYSRKDHMNQHYKYECGRPPRYQCPYCPSLSKQPGNMYKHVRTKHPKSEVKLVRLY